MQQIPGQVPKMEINNYKTKIIDYLSNYEESANAEHLSRVLSIKPATVRSTLSRLDKEGVLRRDDKLNGFYKINPVWQNSRHGVSSGYQYNQINFQNIVATVYLHKDVTFFQEERIYPCDLQKPIWKIKITLGATNSKLTINLSGAPGFDPRSVMLIIDSIVREYNSRFQLEITTRDVLFKTHEEFSGNCRVRMSENLISFEMMNKNMLKIYNKPDGVRSEIKNSAEIPYDMLLKSLTDPSVLNYLSDINEIKKDIIDLKNTQSQFSKDIITSIRAINDSMKSSSLKCIESINSLEYQSKKQDISFKPANEYKKE